jgi:hypothetical protein
MRPGRLERHLMTNHKALYHKPKEFLVHKLQYLKCKKLNTTEAFHQETAELVEESYELPLHIAKTEKKNSSERSF